LVLLVDGLGASNAVDGDRSAVDVAGLESASCTDFLRAIDRRIQDGDNRSMVVGGSVDITNSDIEEEQELAEGWRSMCCCGRLQTAREVQNVKGCRM
jgi:hypothetical protein